MRVAGENVELFRIGLSAFGTIEVFQSPIQKKSICDVKVFQENGTAKRRSQIESVKVKRNKTSVFNALN